MPRWPLVLCVAACTGGPASRVARHRTPLPPREPIPTAPARGERDAQGQPHGPWVLDCDAIPRGCQAWYEHGVQVQWGRISGTERYLVDAIDGGWRWQWWVGGALRAQAWLAFQPPLWVGDHEVASGDIRKPPHTGACAREFWERGSHGVLELSGRCEHGRWVERVRYDADGTVERRELQSNGVTEVEHFDAGRLAHRSRRTLTGDSLVENYFPDGRLQLRRQHRAGEIVEQRGWYEDGQLAVEDRVDGTTRSLRRWSRRGRLVSTARWDKGLPTGWWRTWYRDGRPRSAVRFAPPGVAGRFATWRRDGSRAGSLARHPDLLAIQAIAPRVVGMRIVGGDRDVLGCGGGLAACRDELQQLATLLLRQCVDEEEPLDAWVGRLRMRWRVTAAGGHVTAIRDPGALTSEQEGCMAAARLDVVASTSPAELEVEVHLGP